MDMNVFKKLANAKPPYSSTNYGRTASKTKGWNSWGLPITQYQGK